MRCLTLGKTVRNIILVIILLILSAAFSYFYIIKKFNKFDWKQFSITGSIILGSLVMIGLIIWLIVWLIYREKKNGLDIIKIPVDSEAAINIWEEKFMLKNNIPVIHQTWNNGVVTSIKDRAVVIRNQKTFSDPSQQTSDSFIGFEAIVNEGDRVGMCVVILRNDLGEEWIKKYLEIVIFEE